MAVYGSAVYGSSVYGYEMPTYGLPTLANPQAALDALDTTTRGLVFVGGVTVDAISWDAQFDVNAATSTARIVLPLPRPESVVANAEVQIVGGHNDLVGTLFSGRIPSWEADMTPRGNLLTIRPVGWSSLLAYEDLYDLTYDGPITLSALFDSLCARRGVPSYRADTVTDPEGIIEVELGGNPNIDDGKVVITASQSPLQYLNNAADPFGYRVYDTPDGTVRLTRVSGLPNTAPVVTFSEGVHLMSGRRRYDIAGVVNYPDIHGQTYEDDTGASVPIRAFPESVVASSLIPVNEGVRKRRTSNSLFVTQQLAEIALAVAQIDRAAPDTPVRWEAVAVPGVSVGDVVTVGSDTIEASGDLWLLGMDITQAEGGGLVATYDGWAGGGTAMPAGDNSTEYTIQTAPVHLGNEVLSHYAVPSPSGTSQTWAITIPDRATAVNIRGLHHGTNSQLIGGVNTDLEVTKWQIWDAAVPASTYDTTGTDAPRPETSGNMPVVDEDLALRKDYDLLSNWAPFAVSLRSLDAGDYVLRLVSGQRASWDDFEVRDVILEVYGIAEPVTLPGEDV